MATGIPHEQLDSFTQEQTRLLEPLIENVERVTGQLPGLPALEELPPGASLGNTIVKVNALLRRIQGIE